MDVYERVSLKICEAKSPKSLPELKSDLQGLCVPEIDLLPILNELVKRGDIISKSICCNVELNKNDVDSYVTVYWKAKQHTLSECQPTKTPTNTLTTPKTEPRSSSSGKTVTAAAATRSSSNPRLPPSAATIRSRLPFKSPAKVTSNVTLSSPRTVSTNKAGSSRLAATAVKASGSGNEFAAVDEQLDLTRTVQRMKKELDDVDKEIVELSSDYSEDELQAHIDALHEYNEMKDVGQILLGKIAEHEGTTTASLYERFGLDVDS